MTSGRILLALLVTVANYVALTLYDVLALRHVARHRLRVPRVGFTSFIGYAFEFNLGVSFLSGGRCVTGSTPGSRPTALDVARVAASTR